jgi:small subunit ribosomal protein S20
MERPLLQGPESRPDEPVRLVTLSDNRSNFVFKEFRMATHASAIKRMAQNEQRRLRNASYRSRVKSSIKKYLAAVDEKDPEAGKLLQEASQLIRKGVSKGVYHRNTASRTISRLARKSISA